MVKQTAVLDFDENCRLCPRLAKFLEKVSAENPTYHAKPVPSFGDERARLIVVGLAPGMHGANRTGRPFTGDHAGLLLYETLHKQGFSNQPTGDDPGDGLVLEDCRITNAVKCLPPQNKPLGVEINTCNRYLHVELSSMQYPFVIVALGTIAHASVLTALSFRKSHAKFSHGQVHKLSDHIHLIDSYHCSRYNTQTKRLTSEMFNDVFKTAKKIIAKLPKSQ